MRQFKIISIMFCILLSSCSCIPGGIIKNTDTALVIVHLKDDGTPVAAPETVTIRSDQRVIIVGPRRYSIIFPNGSPFGDEAGEITERFDTDNGVINLEVSPANIREAKEKGLKERKYKYDVKVGNKVLDPHFIIKY